MHRRSRLAVSVAVLLALGLEGSASPPDLKGFVGSFVWSMAQGSFGGWSGIEVSADGNSFTALSDRGRYVQGRFARNSAGVITAVQAGRVTALKSNTTAPLSAGRSDSEDLALGPDGAFYVSFEGAPRVLRYASIDGLAENLPTPAEFATFPRNASLEALAVDAAGVLYTFPEELKGAKRVRILTGNATDPNGGNFPIWRFAKGRWTQPYDLPRRGSFLPVGADFGPDGRLYVLERDFHGLAGFSSRVRSFTVSSKGLGSERTHMQSATGKFDNLEGLSVWRDAGGAIRLTMVSDDNFLPVQQTQIVEFTLGN